MLSAVSTIQAVDGFPGIDFSAFKSDLPSGDNFSDPLFAFSHQEPDSLATIPASFNLSLDNLNSEPVLSNGTHMRACYTSSSSDYFEPDFLAIEPTLYHSGSYNSKANLEPVLSDPTQKWAHNLNSGSDHVEPDYLILPAEPVLSNSGIENSNMELVNFKPTRKRASNSSSGSDDAAPDQEGILVIDERKRKRMKLNRESARRSRMRKQSYLENLQNQVNQFQGLNGELLNQLSFMASHLHVTREDNNRLQAELTMLRQQLWTVQRIMLFRKLPINQQILPY